MNQQILAVFQISSVCHTGIGPLCGFCQSFLCDVIGAEMIGGKRHCTVHNRYRRVEIGARLINDRYLAGGIEAVCLIQRNRYGRLIPLGISNRINVIRGICGILAGIN